MKILPVLDLKGGVVVRGVAGRREEYRPIVSRWCDDPSPASVARGLREAFGFNECYVADLDAIATGKASYDIYLALDREGLTLWLDAGRAFVNPPLQPELFHFGPSRRSIRTIVGLESLPDDAAYLESIAWVRPMIFSLDLMHGRPLTNVPAWTDWTAEQIADWFVERGASAMIVLDLAGVGVGQGVPTLDLCRRLRAKYPKLELISGGGVRGLDDLHALRDAGCDAALVASALHDGRITPEMLTSF